ncbi:hypothetical protein EMPS_08255 [Entomortierella parvispora]|uniref:Chitin-binding type-1 domain-containing protein n=1 Tax=Entomortierella parvispora TaxID=205924 RepID=A0A9P3HFW1_9FUNG|nr:hypothetical protein EMPS_08255 [Entomortierella parvispora]
MLRSSVVAMLLCCIALLSFVSAQAQCGPGVGSCTGSDCCSSNGYCGADTQYCGTGCQAGFGLCGGGVVSPTAVPSTAVPSATLEPSSAVTSIAPITSVAPSVSVLPTTAPITSETPAASSASAPSTTTRGTFQLQPTGKPNGASSTTSKDKGGVGARLALSVVFMALLLM